MDHRAPSQAGSGSRRKVSCATRQLAGGRDAELRSVLARGRGLLARLGGERPLPARDRRRLPLRLVKASFARGGGGATRKRPAAPMRVPPVRRGGAARPPQHAGGGRGAGRPPPPPERESTPLDTPHPRSSHVP